MSQIINGGKRKTLRKGNNGLKAWVTFVKKVQKEENISYKDAIHRAKVRKDKGEKWMTGGKTTNSNPNPEPNPNPSSSSSSSSSSDTTSSPMNNDEIEEAAARRRVMLEARRTESSRRSALATRPRNRQTQSQAVGRGTRRGTRKRKGRKTKK